MDFGLINSPQRKVSIRYFPLSQNAARVWLYSSVQNIYRAIRVYYIRKWKRAETSVTTTLLHSKAQLPILRFSDSPILWFSDSLVPCKPRSSSRPASLRLSSARISESLVTIFCGFPRLFVCVTRGGAGRGIYVWMARTFVTNWSEASWTAPCYENWQNKWVTKRRCRPDVEAPRLAKTRRILATTTQHGSSWLS